MATNIRHKRSNIPGKSPTNSQLQTGELALNTADGKVFTLQDDNTVRDLTKSVFQGDSKVEVNDGQAGAFIENVIDGINKVNIGTSDTTITTNLTLENNKNLVLKESQFSGTNSTTIRTPGSIPEDFTLTLPNNAGIGGQVLTTDGNGNLDFIAPDSLAGNRIYVSKAFGDDRNDGINAPVASLKRASELAASRAYAPLVTPTAAATESIELLNLNKTFIQNETIAYLDSTYSTLNFDPEICSRDVGLIVAGQSYDIVLGTNYNARKAGTTYYNATASQVISSQLTETIDGLGYALDEMIDVVDDVSATAASRLTTNKSTIIDIVTNGVSSEPAISLPAPAGANTGVENAKVLLLSNLSFIQEEVISYINDVYTGFTYDQAKCERDLGLILDGLELDIQTGSNYNSITAGLAYQRANSNYLQQNQLIQTVAALKYGQALAESAADIDQTAEARVRAGFVEVLDIIENGSTSTDQSADPVVYPVPTNAAAGTEDTVAQLQDNRDFIAAEVNAYIAANYQNFTFDNAEVSAEITEVINAAAFDTALGTNYNAVTTGLRYMRAGGDYQNTTRELQTLGYVDKISTDVLALTDVDSSVNAENRVNATITEIKDIIENGVVSTATNANALTFPAPTGGSQDKVDAKDQLQANRTFCQKELTAYIQQTYPGFVFNAVKCERDTGYIIDALSYDVLYGGDSATLRAAEAYLEGINSQVSGQQTQTAAAFAHLATILADIVQGVAITKTTGNVENQDTSSGNATATEATDIDNLLQYIEDTVANGNTNTFPGAVTYPVITWATSEYQDASSAITSGLVTLRADALTFINTKYQSFTYNATKCARDVRYIVDGLSYDLMYGGNFATRRVADSYFVGAVSQVTGQLDETEDAFRYFAEIVDDIITATSLVNPYETVLVQNTINAAGSTTKAADAVALVEIVKDVIKGGIGSIPSLTLPNLSWASSTLQQASTDLDTENTNIINSTVSYVNSVYNLTYDQNKCRRDTKFIIESIAYDLIYGSNAESTDSGLKYYDGVGSLVQLQIAGQEVATADAVVYAKTISQNVVQNQVPATVRQSGVTQTIDLGAPGSTAASTQIGLLYDVVVNIIENGPTAAPTIIYPDLSAYSQGLQDASSDLVDATFTIQQSTLDYLIAKYGGFSYNRAKCRRDVGYIIDSVVFDLEYGGNSKAVYAGKSYNFAVSAEVINNQKVETLDGILFAKFLATKVLSNTQPVDNEYDSGNIYTNFTYDSNAFEVTIERLVDAIRLDAIFNSNYRTIATAKELSNNLILPGEVDQFVDAYTNNTKTATTGVFTDPTLESRAIALWNEAIDIVSNGELNADPYTYPTPTGGTDNASDSGYLNARNQLINNKEFIKDEIVAWIAGQVSLGITPFTFDFTYNVAKCERDVGLIVDALIYDITYGGNLQTYDAAASYYIGALAQYGNGEKDATVAAYERLKEVVGKIIIETTVVKSPSNSLSQDFSQPAGSNNAKTFAENRVQEIISYLDGNGVSLPTRNTPDITWTSAGFQSDYALLGTAQQQAISAGSTTYVDNAIAAAAAALVGEPVETYQTTFTQTIDNSLTPDAASTDNIKNGFDVVVDILDNGNVVAPSVVFPQYVNNPTTILMATGDYTEVNPIIVPDGVSIIGDNLRGVIIRPSVAGADMFRIRNGCYVNGFTFRDQIDSNKIPSFTFGSCVAFDNVDEEVVSTRGAYVGLPASKPIISQSPYIQNCSIISFLGGDGVTIDGDLVVDPNIPNVAAEVENPANAADGLPQQGKSMVANAFTHLGFGGTGWRLINDSYAQIVSCFQIFLLNGSFTQSGGYLSITNSATNFGLFALRSSGFSRNAFTFDRGIIAGTGVFEGLQTIITLGTRRSPVEQFVSRFRTVDGAADQTSSFKNTSSVVAVDSTSNVIVDLTGNQFDITAHGLLNGQAIVYFTDGSQAIGGLDNEQTYYVNLINDNAFGLYFDDSLTKNVDLTSLGTGTHRLVVDPEEFFVNEVVESHNSFQVLSLAAGTYNFTQGQAIQGATGATSNAAYVYTYNSTTNQLVVSVEKVIFDGSEIRILFDVGSTILEDADGNTSILVTSVSSRNDLYKATVTLRSTTDGNQIQNVNGLPGRVVWFHRPSICNSSAHTWEYAGSGTDYNALPQNGGETISEYEQVSDLPGRVYSSGTDELGNFKVGDFITAENKTGNITFRNTVTVGELNALKLSLSDVEITNISTDVNLGDDDPGGASNSTLSTQLAVRSFLENRLGDFIDKNVSTNQVPGGVVQLNANGTINQELIPATRNFNSIILDEFNARFEVIENIPPTSLVVGDIVTENFFVRDITLSAAIDGTIDAGTIITQANTGTTGIVTQTYTNASVIEVANLSEAFSTLAADVLFRKPSQGGDLYSSDSSAIYVTGNGVETTGATNLVIVDDTIAQVLVLFDGNDSANYDFTVGNQIVSSLNSAVGTITDYRNGVMMSVDVVAFTPGSGYVPGASTQTYTNIPLITVTGVGEGARADVTVTNGSIDNIDVTRGGLGYNVGDRVSVSNVDVGGLGSGFETTVLDIHKRLYLDLDTTTKFIGSATNNDFIQDNTAELLGVADTSAVTLINFDARDTASGGNVNFVNNSIVITNHGLQTGDTIVYSSSPNIPVSPLINNNEYFVERIDSNNIRLYDDYTLTTVITVSSSSTGSHSITYRPITIGTDGFNIRNHGFDTGDSLEVELASGVIPEGLVNGQRLFVGSVGVNTFTLHSVRADALNSVNGLTQTPVNISNVGSSTLNLIKNNVKVIDAFNSSSSKPEAYSTLTTSNIDAANIISGTINPGRLASAGIANTDTYLRGDSTWATAVSSLELETGTPLNVVGSFDSDSTGTFYFGAVKLSIDTVDPDEGNPNFTNTGVVSLFKQQFDVTDSGEVSIKDGVVDAGQLGGQLPSYYLDPANLLQEVAVSKGGTGLTAVLQGALLYGSGGGNDLTALTIGAANQVLTTSGAAPQWSDSISLDGDVAVNGGDITTTATTFNLINENANTVNFAGAGSAITIGADSLGTTTVRNDLIINGDLQVNGTAITINSTQITVDEPLFNIGGQVLPGSYTQGAGSSLVTITIDNHGLEAGANIYVDFTTVTGSLRADGTYTVVNVTNENVFTISSANTQASTGTIVIYTQTTDDNKDRGVTFQYVDGTPKQGFFGWDDSIGAFTVVPDGASNGDVISGNKGTIASASHSFYDGTNQISITGVANVTNIGTAAPIAVDSWDLAVYRSAKYILQIESTTGDFSTSEILVIHNGATASMTQYGIVRTGSANLADVTADINAGNVRLLVQSASGTCNVKVTRTLTTV